MVPGADAPDGRVVRRTVLLLVLAAAVALGAAAAVDAAPASAKREPGLEAALVKRLNALRVAEGLRPLTVSPALRNAAAAHSSAMGRAGFFAHESQGGEPFWKRVGRFYRSTGFGTWSVGENLLFASAPLSAEGSIQAWLDSPPHKRNLLASGWREVGCAALTVAEAPGVFGGDTVVLVTCDFGIRARGR